MNFLRSCLYTVLFFVGTVVLGILYIPVLLFPRRIGQPFYKFWLDYALFCVRHVLGIRADIRDADGNRLGECDVLPKELGPVIVASKHQSVWETLIFNRLFNFPAFVLKKELTRIPLFGWCLAASGQIAVDRSAGSAALKQMVAQGRAVIAGGRHIVIYPQGTRVPPHSTREDVRYHPGVAALYKNLGVPVVPVALNSGVFWGRRAFRKQAGTVRVQLLAPIEPGLDRKEFMRRLEDAIETASARLPDNP